MAGNPGRHESAQPALALAHPGSRAVPCLWVAAGRHGLLPGRELPQSSECSLVRAGRPFRNDKRDVEEKRGATTQMLRLCRFQCSEIPNFFASARGSMAWVMAMSELTTPARTKTSICESMLQPA